MVTWTPFLGCKSALVYENAHGIDPPKSTIHCRPIATHPHVVTAEALTRILIYLNNTKIVTRNKKSHTISLNIKFCAFQSRQYFNVIKYLLCNNFSFFKGNKIHARRIEAHFKNHWAFPVWFTKTFRQKLLTYSSYNDRPKWKFQVHVSKFMLV